MTAEENLGLFISSFEESIKRVDEKPHRIIYPLYHGTDKKVLSLREDERKELKLISDELVKYFYNILSGENFLHSDYKQKVDIESDEWIKKILAYTDVKSYMEGSGLFQYDDLYFTIAAQEAFEYANKAKFFGEIGYYAFQLYQIFLINHKQEEIPTQLQEKIQKILCFSNKESNPIIKVLFNADYYECTNEYNDVPFSWHMSYSMLWSTGMSFRYKTSVDLDKDCFELLAENYKAVDKYVRDWMKDAKK